MHVAALFIKYKIHHLLFWVLLFGVWYFLRYEDYSTTERAFQVTLIKVIDLALMITITNYILIIPVVYRLFCFVGGSEQPGENAGTWPADEQSGFVRFFR
jgi:hypothetical protein